MPTPTPRIDVLSEPVLPRPALDTNLGPAQAMASLGPVIEGLDEARADRISSNLTADLNSVTGQVAEEAYTASVSPNVAEILELNQEDSVRYSQAAAPVRELIDAVAKQKLAAEQSTITETQLKLRHEATLREYLNKYPQYAQELSTAAGMTLGYNPMGAHIEALVASQKAAGAGGGDNYLSDFDDWAKGLGVDITKKFTDPVGYYTTITDMGADTQKLAMMKLQMDTLTTDDAIKKFHRMEEFKARAAGQYFNEAAGITANLLNAVQAAGVEGLQSFDEVREVYLKNAIAWKAKTRASLMTDWKMDASEAQTFMAPIDAMIDLAFSSVTPNQLQERLGLIREIGRAKVYMENPNLPALEIAAEMWKNIPKVEGALQREKWANVYLAQLFRLINPAAVVVGDGGFSPDPKKMTPEQRSAMYRTQVDTLRSIPAMLSNPEFSVEMVSHTGRAATIQIFDWIKTERDMNKGGDKVANTALMRLYQDPKMAKIWGEGYVPPEDYARVRDAHQFALDWLHRRVAEKRTAINEVLAEPMTAGGATIMDNRPGIRRKALIEDLVEFDVSKDGKVTITANWKPEFIKERLNITGEIPKATRDQVDKQLKELNYEVGPALSQTIRALAHFNGDTDYKKVLMENRGTVEKTLFESTILGR